MFCGGQQENSVSQVPDKIKKIQNYVFKYSDKVGQGNFSSVYSALDESTGQRVAVKVVSINSMKSKVLSNLLNNQVKILNVLSHENVIKTIEILTSVNNCYMVTQYCENGDLEKLLKKKRLFDEKEIYKYAYGIYKGLLYLAQLNIVHRDFKLANVFLNSENIPKIADFGFAVQTKQKFKDISIGSPIYMSPEGLINHQYGPKTDIWSFGVMLYEMSHGDTPLSYARTQDQLKKGILKRPKFRSDIDIQMKQCIQLCMNIVEQQRINIHQLGQTKFIKKIFSINQIPKISKQLLSTNHSSDFSTCKSPKGSKLISWVLPYDQILALIHYCRLVHKTAKQVNSLILSQWLLCISYELNKINISHQCPKATQAKDVIREYHQKYSRQYLIIRQQRTIDDAIAECLNLLQGNNPFKTYINILLNDSQQLKRYLRGFKSDSFAKNSLAQNFLQDRSNIKK